MLTASVIRKQYAVGHGGFHSGRIAVRKDGLQIPNLLLFDSTNETGESATIFEKFYVYDCGSESPRSFERALRSHRLTAGDRTDILFVSHLNSDHANKIDHFMGAAAPRIVVLPYLDCEDLAALFMRELDDGTLTASIREYVSDPGEWWRRRGAETVIFVEPGKEDDQRPVVVCRIGRLILIDGRRKALARPRGFRPVSRAFSRSREGLLQKVSIPSNTIIRTTSIKGRWERCWQDAVRIFGSSGAKTQINPGGWGIGFCSLACTPSRTKRGRRSVRRLCLN